MQKKTHHRQPSKLVQDSSVPRSSHSRCRLKVLQAGTRQSPRERMISNVQKLSSDNLQWTNKHECCDSNINFWWKMTVSYCHNQTGDVTCEEGPKQTLIQWITTDTKHYHHSRGDMEKKGSWDFWPSSTLKGESIGKGQMHNLQPASKNMACSKHCLCQSWAKTLNPARG